MYLISTHICRISIFLMKSKRKDFLLYLWNLSAIEPLYYNKGRFKIMFKKRDKYPHADEWGGCLQMFG